MVPNNAENEPRYYVKRMVWAKLNKPLKKETAAKHASCHPMLKSTDVWLSSVFWTDKHIKAASTALNQTTLSKWDNQALISFHWALILVRKPHHFFQEVISGQSRLKLSKKWEHSDIIDELKLEKNCGQWVCAGWRRKNHCHFFYKGPLL